MVGNLFKKLDIKLLKYVAVVTTLVMIIAHGFCYFNILYSHDSLNIFHAGYFTDSLEIGRFLIPVWNLIRGEYYPPLLIGFFSIVFMIFIVYFVCKLFSINSKKYVFLVSCLFCTSSTITLLNATYINYSDMYIFSILLNVLSVYFIRKKGYWPLVSIFTLFISYGIYQAYLGVTLGICIGLLIIDLLHKKDWKVVFKEGIKELIIILISLILYSITNKLIINLLNINVSNSYNSISSALKFSSILDIFKYFIKTYLNYLKCYLYPHTVHRIIVLALNIVVSIIAIFNFIKLIKKNELSKLNIIFIVLLCLVLPFALNIIYFISTGESHGLMIFAINITYVYIIYLLLNKKGLSTKIIYLALIIIICCNIIYSNQVYEKKKIELDSTISTINRVIYKVETIEGYKVGKTPVVIVGKLDTGPLSIKKENLDYGGVGLFSTFSTTYNRNYYRFINYYMGYPMNIVDKDVPISEISKKFEKKEEVKNMPCYPSENSIKMIDGYLVIKFS